MKRKSLKLLSLILVLSLVLPVLALTACTSLDDVEESLVGKWINSAISDIDVYVFHDDGTFSTEAWGSGTEGTFKHSGSGTTTDGRKYEIITFGGDNAFARIGPYYLVEGNADELFLDKECENHNGSLMRY